MRARKGAHHIAVPVYSIELWVVIEDTFKDAAKRLRRVAPNLSIDTNDDNEYDGLMMWSGARKYAIFLSTDALREDPHNMIAHEMLHFTLRVLTNLGEKLNAEFDEQAAHLCGWVTSRIYEKLK